MADLPEGWRRESGCFESDGISTDIFADCLRVRLSQQDGRFTTGWIPLSIVRALVWDALEAESKALRDAIAERESNLAEVHIDGRDQDFCGQCERSLGWETAFVPESVDSQLCEQCAKKRMGTPHVEALESFRALGEDFDDARRAALYEREGT